MISNDYMVYLGKHDIESDLMMFSQAIRSKESIRWMKVIKDEMALMNGNQVWEFNLVHEADYKCKNDSFLIFKSWN